MDADFYPPVLKRCGVDVGYESHGWKMKFPFGARQGVYIL